ncbi:uncharacterized protein LOC126553187 [Aphis gossypii]|uniref:uncharacterized protein LOC126553187 n=1 Tax=Aphis gossypii TaxID=80765 RepID=UPI002158EC2C|nr:uncharacterized protein LOC126553187 [Aphis gossypii]
MKRIYKSGAAKKAERNKKALLAIQSSPHQKKISFPILEQVQRVEIAANSTKNTKTDEKPEHTNTKTDEMPEHTSMDNNGFNENNADNMNENSNIINFIRPSRNDSIAIKNNFFSKHPIQPMTTKGKLNFKRIYYKELPNGEVIQRKWISYCIETNCLYCSNCMAYGKPVNVGEKESKFISGYESDIKLQKCLYRDIVRHENSIFHQNSSCTAVRFQLNKDIECIINRDVMAKRSQEVHNRRQVLERLIDIVIFIGRQGIPYRGKHEAANSLKNIEVNHGNFLELVLLISKYDTILNQHVKMSITLSEKAKSKKGRGSLITFMSKNFINNNIIIPIGAAIQGTIVKEIKECIKFSIMIDSTQDVSVMDQLAICVRYIFNGVVQERLLSLVVCHNSSGIGLFNLLKEEIKKLGLMLNDIVACSFDGAANMKGIYNGLQAHLKSVNPNIVYTHCMGHVLNLVMSECSTDINLAEDLFGLVEQSAVFLSDSHKRMETWTSITSVRHTGHDKLYRLQKIGATRWWSKDKALSSVMDLQLNIVEIDEEVDNAKFTTLLTFLTTVCHGNFNSQSKFIAKSLINTIQNSIETRFMKNENLLKDLNWLDPRSFAVINNIELLHVSALSTLSKISGLNHEIILTELKQFSNQYENFIPQIPKYTTDCDSENKLLLRNEDASDEDNDEISK